MKVPLLDLASQHAAIRGEVEAAVSGVFESQQFVLGPDVAALEGEIAAYCGTKHAIACASGSDALLLAMMALGIGSGDEVITTPFTFFATAGAIVRLGARPVFVDIDPGTHNIDPANLGKAITERTRAIIPVHLYGQCAEMAPILEIAADRRVAVIEDAAQAIGATCDGRRAGSFGAIGCFSFYPTKNLGAAGDAGMMTTNDDALAERLSVLRVHGGEQKYFHREVGINSRLDSIQAAVLRVKLRYLDRWSDARGRLAMRYGEMFAEAGLLDRVGLPRIREGARHIFHQYVIRVARRDDLKIFLAGRGVGTDIYYPLPLHRQECFANLGYSEGDLPESERAAREVLALPVYPELTGEQQAYVVEMIGEFFKG